MESHTQAAKGEIVLSQAAFSAALRQALKDAQSLREGLQIDVWSLHGFLYTFAEGWRKGDPALLEEDKERHAEAVQEYRESRN